MVKKRITIPKGLKDCQGTECDKNYEFEVDIPDTQATVTTIPTIGVTNTGQTGYSIPSYPQQIVLQQPAPTPDPKPDKKEDPHELLSRSMPKGINFAKCEGGDCGHQMIKSKVQTKKYKACPHCKANTVPKSSDYCPTCGIDEEKLKDDEWEESDIEFPENEEEDE